MRGHKVLHMETRLVQQEHAAFWCFCIQYLPVGFKKSVKKKQRTDYKKELDEESFKRFSTYREIRKQIAKEEAIPAYAVFTDKELSKLAVFEELTTANMKTIKGVGEKKIEKYGSQIHQAVGR